MSHAKWTHGVAVYKHQEFRASGCDTMHYGIGSPEKWAPTLECPP